MLGVKSDRLRGKLNVVDDFLLVINHQTRRTFEIRD